MSFLRVRPIVKFRTDFSRDPRTNLKILENFKGKKKERKKDFIFPSQLLPYYQPDPVLRVFSWVLKYSLITHTQDMPERRRSSGMGIDPHPP